GRQVLGGSADGADGGAVLPGANPLDVARTGLGLRDAVLADVAEVSVGECAGGAGGRGGADVGHADGTCDGHAHVAGVEGHSPSFGDVRLGRRWSAGAVGGGGVLLLVRVVGGRLLGGRGGLPALRLVHGDVLGRDLDLAAVGVGHLVGHEDSSES